MNPEITTEHQEIDLPGQLAFFPEIEQQRAEQPHSAEQPSLEPPPVVNSDSWCIRILTADILLRFEGILPEQWLYDIMVGSKHVTYFQYSDAIGALTENNCIVPVKNSEGVDCYALTETGTAYVRRLRGYVPKIFRDQVHLTALRYYDRQRALKDLQITTEPAPGGYRLCLRCMDHGEEMFYLRIQASTEENAEMLSERILRNPARFFGGMLDLALNNEEIHYDLSDN